jgi:arylsulfatase A-like enzyme
MDWLPTVPDFRGIQQPSAAPKPDGHSLLPALRDAAAPDAWGGVLHFE